jgi:hypothetical protein
LYNKYSTYQVYNQQPDTAKPKEVLAAAFGKECAVEKDDKAEPRLLKNNTLFYSNHLPLLFINRVERLSLGMGQLS